MGKKLFVGNLSFDTSSADLEAMFAQAGTCESAAVDHRSRHRTVARLRFRRDELVERGAEGHRGSSTARSCRAAR